MVENMYEKLDNMISQMENALDIPYRISPRFFFVFFLSFLMPKMLDFRVFCGKLFEFAKLLSCTHVRRM